MPTTPTTPTPNPTFLTAEEAAAYLGSSVDELMFSFYRGLSPGSLGFKKTPASDLTWKRTDLDKLIKEQKVEDKDDAVSDSVPSSD